MMATFFREFWVVLCEMSPYLLLGFLIAGILSVAVSPRKVQRHLGGNGLWPVVKATLLGIPLPLCSCGVIPVSASLRRQGASRGSTVAFLLSTPQTGADSIMVTYSLLGPVFAVFRPLAALVTGIAGGLLTRWLAGNGEELKSGLQTGRENGNLPHGGNLWTRIYRYGFVTLPRDISKTLAVGLLLAALISVLVPDDFLSTYLDGGLVAMIVMMLFGIPVYVCATASVPVAAALILKGVSPGAALVFLLTGPATNAATISTIWKILGKRVTAIYLGVVAASALVSGILIDALFDTWIPTGGHVLMDMELSLFKQVSAVVLVLVLAYAVFWKQAEPDSCCAGTPRPENRTIHFQVEGMHCSHCVSSIKEALLSVPGIREVTVEPASGDVSVRGEAVDVSQALSAVSELGYRIRQSD